MKITEPAKQIMSNLSNKLMPIMQKIYKNIVIIATIFIATPIVIALIINYARQCQRTYYIVPYQEGLPLCYTQSATTERSILDQLLKYNYAAEISDSTSLQLTPAYYVNGLGVYYQFLDFSGQSTTMVHILTPPPFVPQTYKNFTIFINTGGLQSGGIHIPLQSWKAQTESMRIQKFTMSTDIPYQIPIRYTDSTAGYHLDMIVTYNKNCAIEAKLGNKIVIPGTSIDDVCVYVYGVAGNGPDYVNQLCEQTNCNDLVDYFNNVTALIKNDLETNVFSISPITYALPDRCQETQCIGIGLFQTILVCISTTSTAYVLSKFSRHMYKKRRDLKLKFKNISIRNMLQINNSHTNNNTEMPEIQNV